MFRDIRKKKNQISTEAAEQLLREARRGILAVNGREGYPYAIPINYYYDREAQKIYFHGARAGHKAEAIRACDKVCFTVYGGETIREEAWAPYLRSVVVFGRCRLLEQSPETMALLKRFAMKYYPEEQLADEEIRQDTVVLGPHLGDLRLVHRRGATAELDRHGWDIELLYGPVLEARGVRL